MTEETKIIELLRNLKKNSNAPNNEEKFLKNLRIKLSNRILTHCVINKKPNIHVPWYLKLSLGNAIVIPHAVVLPHIPHIIAMPQKTIAMVFVICFLGFTALAAASQRSLPGETLYPIKILSEEVQSTLAFTVESKAAIQFDLAVRRVAEVKAILEQKNVKQEILEAALINFQKNTSDTAAIIGEESEKGSDVTRLAKDVNDSLEKNTDSLKQIFEEKNNNLKKEETDLKNKITAAKKINDNASAAALDAVLDETRNKRKALESSWNKSEEALHKDAHKIEEQLEEEEKQLNKKNNAEKIIAEAKKEKRELTQEILRNEPNLALPGLFTKFELELDQAEKAYAGEKYDDAEIFAFSAIQELKNIEKNIDEDEEENQLKNNDKEEDGLDDEESGRSTNFDINPLTLLSGK